MHMDIFNSNAFELQSMTAAVEKIPFVPGFVGSLGIFMTEGVPTDTVTIERKDHTLTPILTSLRGTDPPMGTTDRAKLRSFPIPRVAKADQVSAREIANVRAFGTESELLTAAKLIAQKQMKLRQEFELTMEMHRLSAAQGILLDADNNTVIENWFDNFGISQPNEIDFDLDAASPAEGVLRSLISNSVTRPIVRALGASFNPGVRIIGLCGDTFYDQFVNHNDVRVTYKNWEAASALRENTAFARFSFAGVDWVNYRGTDDNSVCAIGVGKVKFIVTGVPGLFRRINGCGEDLASVNTIGRELYSILVRDLKRNQWVQPEIYGYPLHMCTRPEVLLRGKNT